MRMWTCHVESARFMQAKYDDKLSLGKCPNERSCVKKLLFRHYPKGSVQRETSKQPRAYGILPNITRKRLAV